jgi:hypothetical protein
MVIGETRGQRLIWAVSAPPEYGLSLAPSHFSKRGGCPAWPHLVPALALMGMGQNADFLKTFARGCEGAGAAAEKTCPRELLPGGGSL